MKPTSVLFLLPAWVAAGPGINPNPNPKFDPASSDGTFGPFVAAQRAATGATGGPQNVDVRTKQAMQLAMSNWMTDTGIVSGFQNVGADTTDETEFKGIADGAFKAEVDELTQKAVLDAAIGSDPRVSVANLTLTNGVFQSVVDNLQIMSVQGMNKSNLIDSINQVRCTQILPSIDTYMVVAAEYIGNNAQQRRSVRPSACGKILSAAARNSSAFPNVPGTPNGTPKGKGDGNIQGVPGVGQMGAGNLTLATTKAGNTTGNANSNAASNGGKVNAGSSGNAPLANQTTPDLGLPGFPSSNNNNGNANSGDASGTQAAANGKGTATPAKGAAPAAGTDTGRAQKGKKGKKAHKFGFGPFARARRARALRADA